MIAGKENYIPTNILIDRYLDGKDYIRKNDGKEQLQQLALLVGLII